MTEYETPDRTCPKRDTNSTKTHEPVFFLRNSETSEEAPTAQTGMKPQHLIH